MSQKRAAESSRPAKRNDLVKARADLLYSHAHSANVWYHKNFADEGLEKNNSFSTYVHSTDCYNELYDLAVAGYTPRSFLMGLRNPAAAVGLIQHLDSEHFTKFALWAADQDPDAFGIKAIPPTSSQISPQRQATQVVLKGYYAFLEPFRNGSVTLLQYDTSYQYAQKYAGRLVSADEYLKKIGDEKRNLKKLCEKAGISQRGQKYMKGGFALVIMNELSSLKEITKKFEKRTGTFHGPTLRAPVDEKAKAKFALMDDGEAKEFIKTYLKSAVLPKKKKDEEIVFEG
jgi:hypothetical protein